MSRFEAVDALAREVAAGIAAPALVHGVIHGGSLVHVGAVGALDDGAVPDDRTLFRIASMTKSFTAAAVLLLRDRRVLSLDLAVEEVLPGTTAWSGRRRDEQPVTVRDLLSMGSGLATDDAWADRHLDLTSAEMLEVIADGRSARANGGGFEYSNLGYGLLGEIVRALTGHRVQEVITHELLGPLGMRDTVWQPDALAVSRRIARPHRNVDGRAEPEGHEPPGDGALAPMGGLWSTVADLARWVAFLLDAHPARDDDDHGPISRATRREMQRGHRAVGLVPVPGHGNPLRRAARAYGYGLQQDDDERLGRVVDHSGGLPGYGSNMRWIPARDLGIVALANVTYAPMRELTYRQLDALHAEGVLPPLRDAGDASIHACAARLADLLLAWSRGEGSSEPGHAQEMLFADNVVADDPIDHRRQAMRAIATQHGALSIGSFTASTLAAGVLRLFAADGTTIEVRVELAPFGDARVQRYTLTTRDASTGGP